MIFFKRQPSRLIKIIGTLFILAILTYLHFMTVPTIPTISVEIIGIDKLTHLLMFLAHLLMFFLTMIWFVNIIQKPYWNVVGGLLVFFGLLLEWLQMQFFPGRSFEWLDWFADSLGVVVCIYLWHFIMNKLVNSSV